MELFAAATGCSDAKIARYYLECAGDDVTRAVNHYLDAPPPLADGEGKASTAAGRHERSSPPRALKRPRASERNSSSQQEFLAFEAQDRSSVEAGGSCSKGAWRRFAVVGATTAYTKPVHAAVPAATATLSAEWSDIVQRCQSEGVLFEDAGFPPQPTSLDGRPGRGKLAGDAEDQHYRQTSRDDRGRVTCECAAAAKVVTVTKAGVNQGRLFYGCVTRKCSFFRWADDAPHTRQALSLVWRRFSPPRFKLCAASGRRGDDSGYGFKPQDIRQNVDVYDKYTTAVNIEGALSRVSTTRIQGAVGDCWFLAGLAVVSERPDLISRVLGGNGLDSDRFGCYEVNLFKDGRWERILVDSWLPCKDPNGLKGKEKGLDHIPAFAKASSNQIWPCVVEKAFAKQHGSYDAISGGHVCEAFEALTGAPTETIMLDDDDSETSWAKLLSFSHAEFPMGCATAWDPTRDLRDVGLVSTHAYSVLEVRELPPGVRGARQPSIRDWAGLGSATAAAEKARMRNGDSAARGGGGGQPLRLVRVRNPWRVFLLLLLLLLLLWQNDI